MPLFTPSQISQINKAAEKSKATLNPPTQSKKAASIVTELAEASALVQEYFKDSEAVCIKSVEQLHEYIDLAIQCGWVGIDTETTGLDRIHDTIVGWSLYYPGGYEVYIPCKHRVPIFEDLYKDQISYEESRVELQRLVDAKVKMILANADFDIAMIYKDIKVDIIPCVYFDVILAWRCIKEDEKDNALKILWAKYVMKGKVIGKKFSDFFNPKIFPYAKPEIAALYASNDAKITWELFTWQLPYVTIDNPKCKKHHLEDIAKLMWNVEMPMIKVCAMLHRTGFYIDTDTVSALSVSYHERETKEVEKLQNMIQEYINTLDKLTVMNSPFKSGKDFNFSSPVHVKYLLYKMMKIPFPESEGTGKEVLQLVNHPITDQILKARGVNKLINTYVDKLPTTIAKDGRIHGCFKSIGAATGRMCISEGTQITCLNGTKTIEDIVPGDLVYCYDDTQLFQLRSVKHLWLTGANRDCVTIRWSSKSYNTIGELICTPEHPILTRRGEWVRADQLNVGDALVRFPEEDSACLVTAVEYAGKYTVYDIEVEDIHNFIANGICVHNSSEAPNMQNIPSHATDIRHMFRATPESFEKLDSTDVTDNEITFTVPRWYSVTVNSSLVEASTVNLGDNLSILDNNVSVTMKVTNVEEVDENIKITVKRNA